MGQAHLRRLCPAQLPGRPPSRPMPARPENHPVTVGVQLAAAYDREDVLIQVASQLEQAAPWAGRHPPALA